MQTKKTKTHKKTNAVVPVVVEFDLVCGMELAEMDIKAKADHKGKTYYFCAIHCKDHFIGDPGKYTGE